MLPVRFTLALLLSLLGATATGAATISVTFTGTIIFVPSAISSGPFMAGDAVSGSFQIDSSTPDTDALATEGEYGGAVSNLSISFGGYDATGGANNELHMRNGTDNFFVQTDLNGAGVAGFPAFHFLLDLADTSGAVFSSDAIPASLDLADFDIQHLLLGFLDGSTVWTVDASFDSLTYTVPEPGALALLAFGGAALAALRRRS